MTGDITLTWGQFFKIDRFSHRVNDKKGCNRSESEMVNSLERQAAPFK